MPKSKAKLKFRTVHDLWEFARRIQAGSIEINVKELTIICDCNEFEIGIASDEYKAEVIPS